MTVGMTAEVIGKGTGNDVLTTGRAIETMITIEEILLERTKETDTRANIDLHEMQKLKMYHPLALVKHFTK